MKTIDLFCASPSSTAICSAMDSHNPHISHRQKSKKVAGLPNCSSKLPFDPKHYYQKNRKSTSSKQSEATRRKSSADDLTKSTSPPGSSRYLLSDTPFIDFLSDSDHLPALVHSQSERSRRLSSASNGFHNSKSINSSLGATQPLSSPRLSFNESHISKSINSPLVASQTARSHCVSSYETLDSKSINPPLVTRPSRLSYSDPPSVLRSSSTGSQSNEQVVELRVSIHCKGCEGKVRKHISRMEGVKSFVIDREIKKVTVIGDVTPLGVLTNISRVKNAQFWPSPTSSSSPKALL